MKDNVTFGKENSRILPGPQFHTKLVDDSVPIPDTTAVTEKFGKKVLVWQVIACDLFIIKGTLNTEMAPLF